MQFSRREFLPLLSAVVAAPSSSPALQPDSLPPFVDALPIPTTAQPSKLRDFRGSKLPVYRIGMREIAAKVHRDLPATKMWAYGTSSPGPTIEARSGQPLFVEWANELPTRHFLPIDYSLHGAERDKPDVRTVVHLHGGRVPPGSDGYPENWYTPGKSSTTFYPNRQDAAALFYHDHAMGITRLNTYAGMFGMYLIRDAVEDGLNLPKGPYEMPLVIADRTFAADGQLIYPVSGKKASPWTAEVFGNCFLMNGKLSPYCEVEPRLYRFRVLNASNARFYRLSFGDLHPFQVIGGDQGLLPAPVTVQRLSLAPGERADVLMDFNQLSGNRILMKSDLFTLMQFRVGKASGLTLTSAPTTLRRLVRTLESEAVQTRQLTLGEMDNAVAEPMAMLLNGKRWHDSVSEKPVAGTTEIWSLINLTDDSHPIHLHLVRFQILDRQRFDPFTYQMNGQLHFLGKPIAPAAVEAGWKDTVRADAKMVTRIIVKFEDYIGRYVWHCHIAEHEDNDMMRPYEIVKSNERPMNETAHSSVH